MDKHLSAVDTLTHSSRWDAIFIPAVVSEHTYDDGSTPRVNPMSDEEDPQISAAAEPKALDIRTSHEMPNVKQLTRPASLRHLAQKYSSGADADDSLYWITYAMQPSKVVPIDNSLSEALRKQSQNENYKQMLKEFHLNSINPNKKMEENLKKIEKSKRKEKRAAKAIEKEIWREIKEKFFDEFKELTRKEKMEKKLKSIIFVQTMIRGYLTRRRYKKMKQQQRFYHAIQNLLHEMEEMSNDKKGIPTTGQKSSEASSSGIKTARKTPALDTSYDRNIEEIARITSQALRTPYSQAKKPETNAPATQQKSILPPIDRANNNAVNSREALFQKPLLSSSLANSVEKNPSPYPNLLPQPDQIVSATPLKYDQVTQKSFPSQLNLPLNHLPSIQQSIDHNYTLKRVEDPINQQYSARSHTSGQPFVQFPSQDHISGGYDTPIIQTPRGIYNSATKDTPVNENMKGSREKPPQLIPPELTPGQPAKGKPSDPRSTPQRQVHHNPVVEISTTPSKHDASTLLSPFLEMNEETDPNGTGGYISSPSQNSLSRSLSVSFGQVTNQISPRSEGVLTKRGFQTNTTVPFIHNDTLTVFNLIETRYERNECEVTDLVRSALAADISNFDKVRKSENECSCF